MSSLRLADKPFSDVHYVKSGTVQVSFLRQNIAAFKMANGFINGTCFGGWVEYFPASVDFLLRLVACPFT
jgi:hypothetical protein